MAAMSSSSSSPSSCGACKFLRRRCADGCVFAPFFSYDQGAIHFAAVHKVFGASNVSKLLSHLPAQHRADAAVTVSYEAQARIRDPVYGCVAHVFLLQQQIAGLQMEIETLTKQLAAFAGEDCNPAGRRRPVAAHDAWGCSPLLRTQRDEPVNQLPVATGDDGSFGGFVGEEAAVHGLSSSSSSSSSSPSSSSLYREALASLEYALFSDLAADEPSSWEDLPVDMLGDFAS